MTAMPLWTALAALWPELMSLARLATSANGQRQPFVAASVRCILDPSRSPDGGTYGERPIWIG